MLEEDAELNLKLNEKQTYLMQLITAVSSELITEEVQKQ